jgi:hypothetical protein
MRILDKEGLRLGLPELGFFSDDQQTFERLIGLPDGILLVTGPTGSGKTTTLYSCLNFINRLLKAPATVKEVEIPAEYTTVKKRVVKTPTTTKKVAIPAEYKEVKVHKLVTPPTVKRTATPVEYQEVSHSKLVKEGRMEWRTVLCETNTTPDVVVRIQKALSAAGYNPGPADGVIGAGTHTALRQYQKAKGLAEGGLTAESLRSLGVI